MSKHLPRFTQMDWSSPMLHYERAEPLGVICRGQTETSVQSLIRIRCRLTFRHSVTVTVAISKYGCIIPLWH